MSSRKIGWGRRAKRKVSPQWSVRRLRIGAPSSPIRLLFRFPTEDGTTAELTLPPSELRHPKRLMDKFADFMPVFPVKAGVSDADRVTFINQLATSNGTPLEIIPDRTGFIDKDTFATHAEVLRAHGSRQRIEPLELGLDSPPPFKGTLKGTTNDVLKLAKRSSYLAFGIGVALAAPLPTYLKLHGDKDGETRVHLLAETAVFNFSGLSSSGKSSISRSCMSLGRSPDEAGTFDFSSRGLAELASDSTDMLLVLDDTENVEDSAELVKALRRVVHMIPGGRSKIISRGVDQTKFPQLRWSTFGLCSSPKSIAALAAQHGWKLTRGHKVRLFNIKVPGPGKGGIFDRIPGPPTTRAKRSVKLIAKLERGYNNNHGHVFPEWILHLLSRDHSAEIVHLVEKFVQQVGAQDHGWENRFARKFGIVYAALKLGVCSGLLPWPKNLPLLVATKCYRKAREAAKSDRERERDTPRKLVRLVGQSNRVVVVRNLSNNKPVKIKPRTIALQFKEGGKVKLGVLDGALRAILGSNQAKKIFTAGLTSAGLVATGHGHAGTVQKRIPIERGGQIVKKPRLWVIDLDRLLDHASTKTNGQQISIRSPIP